MLFDDEVDDYETDWDEFWSREDQEPLKDTRFDGLAP